MTEFESIAYTSSPLVDGDEVYTEWRFVQEVSSQRKQSASGKRNSKMPSTLQEIKNENGIHKCLYIFQSNETY